MAGPGPKWVTPATGQVKTRALDRVRQFEGQPFVTRVAVNEQRRPELEAACRAAGLSCDWPTLKARAVELNQAIPNYACGDGLALPETIRGAHAPETLRAWCMLHADDLISETTEQPQHWLWW